MCDVMYSYVQHDLFIGGICCIRTCDVTNSYVQRDAFADCDMSLLQNNPKKDTIFCKRDITHSHVCECIVSYELRVM